MNCNIGSSVESYVINLENILSTRPDNEEKNPPQK